jgi:triacylglycerol lipase
VLILLCCCCACVGFGYYKYFSQKTPKNSDPQAEFFAKKSSYTFDPNTTEYTNDNAGFLCDACNQSYYSEVECQEWAKLNGFNEAFYFFDSNQLDPHTHTQGFVAQNPETLLIVFRGTETTNLSDLLSDLQGAIKVKWGDLGHVHGGFLKAYMSVLNKSFKNVTVFQDVIKKAGNRKIWISGHSLGGALAICCAAQTEIVDKLPVHAVYTFGQPRVGDEKFAETISETMGNKIFRVVNNRDIVTRLSDYTLGYRQFGQEVFFDKNGEKTHKPAKIENMEGALESLRETNDIKELVYGGYAQGLGFLQQLESLTDVNNIMYNATSQIKNHLLTAYQFIFNNTKTSKTAKNTKTAK